MVFVFALLAAGCYGSSDFLGGRTARRAGALTVAVSSQGVALLVAAAAALTIPGVPHPADVLWGAVAGVSGAGGLVVLYWGLARGPMATVAAISAGVAATIPVTVGFLTGDPPSMVAGVGAAITLLAIVMIAWLAVPSASTGVANTAAAPIRRPAWVRVMTGMIRDAGVVGVTGAVAAGLGFGVFYASFSRVGTDAGMWPVLVAKLSAVLILATAAVVARQRLVPRHGASSIVAIGLLDVIGPACYVLAATRGSLPLVGLVTSTYPAATVALASVVLGERPDRRLVGALALALTGVALLSQ
jgi:drug/metabolite transporter (DMT)-like permease